MYLLAALAVAGRAGAQVTQENAAIPVTASRPTAIYVYSFAVNPDDVKLNSGIVASSYRNWVGTDQNAEQLQIAKQTAHNVCVSVASTLDTAVQLNQHATDGSRQILEFTTHTDSGKMPGAGITGPAGAAAGGATAAASIGVNVAAGGVKNFTSSTGYLADKTSSQIVDQVTKYYEAQGWGA